MGSNLTNYTGHALYFETLKETARKLGINIKKQKTKYISTSRRSEPFKYVEQQRTSFQETTIALYGKGNIFAAMIHLMERYEAMK